MSLGIHQTSERNAEETGIDPDTIQAIPHLKEEIEFTTPVVTILWKMITSHDLEDLTLENQEPRNSQTLGSLMTNLTTKSEKPLLTHARELITQQMPDPRG